MVSRTSDPELTLEQEILQQLDRANRAGCTLAELTRGRTPGNWALELEKNCVLWCDMSDEMSSLLTDLIGRNLVHVRACNPMLYMLDGAMLSYPVAKRVKAFKKRRWLPVLLVHAKHAVGK